MRMKDCPTASGLQHGQQPPDQCADPPASRRNEPRVHEREVRINTLENALAEVSTFSSAARQLEIPRPAKAA
jgi:hypothetical protein